MAIGTTTTTTTASDTFNGLDVTLQMTLPTWTDETLPIDVDITTNGIGPSINVAIVVDTSGSTRFDSGSDVDGNTLNGTETFLEAEQFAAKELFQSLIDAGYDPDNVNITLVEYNTGANLVGEFTLSDKTAFDNAVDGLDDGGGTNFEAGLNTVLSAWDASTTDGNPNNDVVNGDTNLVVFLSDGNRNTGDDASDELTELEDNYGALVTAIGVGVNSNLGSLNIIDNTGGAQVVNDAADLAGVITAPPPLPELVEVEIFIDGESFGVFEPDGADGVLTSTALGYTINCHEISGFDAVVGTDISVEAVARFDDGSSVLTTGAVLIPVTPCFCAGTEILTERGLILVENLEAGDRVLTRDNGLQDIRWIDSTEVSSVALNADPKMRPVKIMKDAFGEKGPHKDLYVSCQHRILVEDWRSELMFDSPRVLASAQSLINETSVTIDHDAENVVYYHVAFDKHEVIFSNGLQTESFHPCKATVDAMKPEAKAELLKLFPVLDTSRLDVPAYPVAYPSLKSYETRVLVQK